MTDLSWRWIAAMIVAPVPVAMLVAMPLWRRGETILGNIAGTVLIFAVAFALIFREWTELDALQRACFDAGYAACFPEPPAFMRYAIYASIGLAETTVLFLVSLSVERRLRERAYAPEWRR